MNTRQNDAAPWFNFQRPENGLQRKQHALLEELRRRCKFAADARRVRKLRYGMRLQAQEAAVFFHAILDALTGVGCRFVKNAGVWYALPDIINSWSGKADEISYMALCRAAREVSKSLCSCLPASDRDSLTIALYAFAQLKIACAMDKLAWQQWRKRNQRIYW